MGQLSLTLAHIRTFWKIEAITNHFAIMKVFIILCIVIGIVADFSVGSPVEKQLQEKEVGNILHKIADFFGRKKREASVTGVNRFKREALAEEIEKQLQEKEVGNFLHSIADFFGRKKREAAVQGNVAIAELDGSDSVTGVDRFKREALAEEIKKQLEEKEVGNFLHSIADWLG